MTVDPTPDTSRLTDPVRLTRAQARTLELMFWCDAQLLEHAADRTTDPEIRADYNLAVDHCMRSARLLAGIYADGLAYDELMAFLEAHTATVALLLSGAVSR